MKSKGKAFLEKYRASSPTPFFVILGLFLAAKMIWLPFWAEPLVGPVNTVSQVLHASALWLTVIYIAFFFILQYPKIWTVLIAAGLVGLVMYLCFHMIYSERQFGVLMTVLLLILSYGRDFRRIMKGVLIANVITLAVGTIGYLAGWTLASHKAENYGEGIAFGLNHPNSFARVVFAAVVLIWYLYLKEKKIIFTFLIFWLPAVPVMLVAKCRTVAVLLIVLPVCFVIYKAYCRRKEGRPGEKRGLFVRILTFAPAICWAVTFILASQMELLERLTAGTKIYNLAVRFVQAGIALKEYGFSPFPRHIVTNGSITANLAGNTERLLYLDSGYVYYTLRTGLIFTAVILVWLCIVNHACVKRADMVLLMVAVFFNIYGFMERMPMMAEHYFLLFYPLAAVPAAAAAAKKKGIP